ncbi:MAG: acetyl-CoA C-acyltransferase FadI, partial [Gammaproteobacteria bacterium]|nr:acetyl-CoA C-acyltransferase FadI [Gammaproteobacteria bacterium]
MPPRKGARVAIVSGLRTPFVKQGTDYRRLTARHLGQLVVRELVQRSGVAVDDIQRVVYGQVIPTPKAPNIAREVVLGAALPVSIDAYSVSRACATSYQATANLAESISARDCDCGIAGGAESASDVPITVSRPLADALVNASKARRLQQRLRAFKSVKLRDLIPVPPALREPSSDYTMGEAAEKMAKENAILRDAQDEFAHRSHHNAAAAWNAGVFASQVAPLYIPPDYAITERDNLVRENSNLVDYAPLRPVFDRRHGTVTAGNSSPLTDGAAALLLMHERKAKALGLEVLGYLRSFAFAALDPNEQMLMGPSYATPIALKRARADLRDMDLIDMHEAFAAQVLSNLQAFESKLFARQKLGRAKPIGAVDPDKLNVSGGSIALGHPFAATGARQIMQLLQDLRRRGGGLGLCTACAAGGLGAAM